MPAVAEPLPRLLYLLMACNLVVGTGVFVLAGILLPISEALHVSVAAAGQAMTAYAVSTALLAPLVLALTGRWARRNALVFGLLLFSLGSLVCALAQSLAVLLAGRVLMGIGAIYTPISGGIAVAMVAPAQRGRALSLVFLGISISYVVGTPFGAWLGLRFGWQWPVALVAAAGLAAAIALAVLLPRRIAAPGASLAGLPRLLAQPAIASTLTVTLLYFTAIFLVFSYIGPVLQALLPMSAEWMSFTLMLFGLAGVVGTLVGGWANDRFGARRTLPTQLSVLASMMALVPLTQGHYAALVAVFFVWGVAGFGMMAPQQSRLAGLSPAQTPILLSLNSSMLYLGTAVGAALGGAVAGSVGFSRLAWVSVPFALAALAMLRLSLRLADAHEPA
jgi:MFS transporter, DHA1 family, inner membrane transport protein